MENLHITQQFLGDASVCYSGGLDSTTVAYLIALQKKGRVHLQTFRHGYGYLFYWWVERSYKSLRKVLGDDAICHNYVKTKDLFDQVSMRSLAADRKKYGQWFGCCLGCTMAVITKVLIYNLERGIPHITFASSVGGQYAVMSMPGTITLQKAYCGRYGVIYSTPLIDDQIVKQAERDLLDKAGIFRGLRFLDKHSFYNQGYCLLSLQHAPDVALNVHPVYDPEQVKKFFNDKLPICEKYIADHFKRTGQDLDACVARMKKITAGSPEVPE